MAGAVAAPFVAFALEWLLWKFVHPSVWFLFYPAVIVSAWLGGLRYGLAATAVSVWLISEFLDGRIVPAVVFSIAGVASALFQERIRKTNQRLEQVNADRQIFAALIGASSDFIGIADADGKPVYVNPAGRRMVGLAPDRSVADTAIADYYAPDQRELARDVIVPTMIERGQWQGETAFRNWQTEAAIPVSDTHFMIRDPDSGQLLGMGTITRDITEHKRLENELRLAEARASGILSTAADAIITIDDDQRITMFNESAEAMFGYARAEAVGAKVDLLLPERLRGRHRDHVVAFEAGDQSARRMGERIDDLVGRRKNGEEFPVAASISKLQIDGRHILTVAVRDITEDRRVQAEQAFLADAGAVLAATLDYEATLTNVAQLVVRDLADFCIVDVMTEGGELQRLQVACRNPDDAWICDVLARVPIDPEHPYLLDSVRTTLQPVLLPRVTSDMLESIAHDEKHLAALNAMAASSAIVAPIVVRGRFIGAIGFVSARASRRYGEHDLGVAGELAYRAGLSIDNARLYHEARAAIRSRDEVLGVVAHDLRNPLNAILLQTALLRQRAKDRGQEPAAAIQRSAQRMNRLIEDLLDVTRLESGQRSVELASVSTLDLLSTCIQTQGPLAAAASLDLKIDVPDQLPDVWADRDRLLQIFENLIGNACKFTPPGGQIVLGAAVRDHEIVFRVADTGAGIPADQQPHVFDRFWQARKAGHAGAGLGLAIVKNLVEAHGGRIWLDSAPGKGTTFYFTLPIEMARAKAG